MYNRCVIRSTALLVLALGAAASAEDFKAEVPPFLKRSIDEQRTLGFNPFTDPAPSLAVQAKPEVSRCIDRFVAFLSLKEREDRTVAGKSCKLRFTYGRYLSALTRTTGRQIRYQVFPPGGVSMWGFLDEEESLLTFSVAKCEASGDSFAFDFTASEVAGLKKVYRRSGTITKAGAKLAEMTAHQAELSLGGLPATASCKIP